MPPTPPIMPADAALLLALVTKHRAALRQYHHLRTFYAPHHKEVVEGYEAEIDRLILRLNNPPEPRDPTEQPD